LRVAIVDNFATASTHCVAQPFGCLGRPDRYAHHELIASERGGNIAGRSTTTPQQHDQEPQ
jgi:hypothetical protein